MHKYTKKPIVCVDVKESQSVTVELISKQNLSKQNEWQQLRSSFLFIHF